MVVSLMMWNLSILSKNLLKNLLKSHNIWKESKKVFIVVTSNFNKLTITGTYELYREMCLANGTRPLSYELYRRDFKSMNIYSQAKERPVQDMSRI